MMKILAFGDSITFGEGDEKPDGWVGRLRDSLAPKHKVINLGVCGNTSNNLMQRLDRDLQVNLAQGEETLILFAIGVNDSQLLFGKNKVSPKRFKENLKNLAEGAKKYTPRVAFVGLTPVDEKKTVIPFWEFIHSRTMEQIEVYDDLVRSFCKTNKLDFIDILTPLKNTKFKDLLADGLHPNAQGYQKMSEIIYKDLIEKRLI